MYTVQRHSKPRLVPQITLPGSFVMETECVSCEVRNAILYIIQMDFMFQLRFAYLTPDCWLEVSLHSADPATGQLDHIFRGFPRS
jgi:hypothetical protein